MSQATCASCGKGSDLKGGAKCSGGCFTCADCRSKQPDAHKCAKCGSAIEQQY